MFFFCFILAGLEGVLTIDEREGRGNRGGRWDKRWGYNKMVIKRKGEMVREREGEF